MKTFPGGLFKNFKSYKAQLHDITDMQKYVLCDAQTSGGLLVAVDNDGVEEVVEYMKNIHHPFYEIGEMNPQKDKEKLIKII